MNLPNWTILPTIIGFFALILTNKDFALYVLGLTNTQVALDIPRLIIKCFVM